MNSLQSSDSEVAARAGNSGYLTNDHTLIIGLKDILPEDILWRREQPQTPAMVCLQEDHVCDCPWQCIPTLAQRCHVLFERFPTAVQLFVLFQRGERWIKTRAKGARDLKVVSKTVPRYWALYITQDFATVRVMRVNYSGLNLILDTAEPVTIPDLPNLF